MTTIKTEKELRALIAKQSYQSKVDKDGDIITDNSLHRVQFDMEARIAWKYYRMGAFDLNDFITQAGRGKLITTFANTPINYPKNATKP